MLESVEVTVVLPVVVADVAPEVEADEDALVVAVVASVDVTDELAVVALVATGVESEVPAEAVAVVASVLVTVVGRSASRCPRARGTDRDLLAGNVPNLGQREVHARRQAQLERLERALPVISIAGRSWRWSSR